MRKLIFVGAVAFLSAVVMLAQTKTPPQNSSQEKSSALKKASVNLTPMNVKTGYWQNSSTIIVIGALGLPPEMLARMTPEQRAKYEAAIESQSGGQGRTRTTSYKGCLTQKDLTTDPFERKDADAQMQCHETVLNSSGSDLELRETCTGEASLDYHIKIHAVDQEHATGTGTGTATMGGHTMKSNIQMNMTWLGASCPAGSN